MRLPPVTAMVTLLVPALTFSAVTVPPALIVIKPLLVVTFVSVTALVSFSAIASPAPASWRQACHVGVERDARRGRGGQRRGDDVARAVPSVIEPVPAFKVTVVDVMMLVGAVEIDLLARRG